MSTSPKRIGKYELRESLARGGMGQVWKAYDTVLLRIVAIKILHPELQNDPNFIARFRQEAQVIASLDHPNIVQIYDFGVANGAPYIVMPYIEGQNLATYILSTSHTGQFPPPTDITRLFRPIADAINYAHSKGVIHRDIKPANILLNKASEPILTDFGLAKLLGTPNSVPNEFFLGSPHYTSPEQAAGSLVNESSDIYSLGIILYEICTGKVPFDGDNAATILDQHCKATPPPPASLNPSITSTLAEVIMTSLAKETNKRYPTAPSMVDALTEAFKTLGPEGLNQLPTIPARIRPNSLLEVLMSGESLEELMNRLDQPMKEQDVLGYAVHVLDQLDELERKTPPIMHGDVKPANIIIGKRDRQAYLVKPKQVPQLGTPGYAPPEQARGSADPRFDLYGLGATMRYLLTGRQPRDYPPSSYPEVRRLNPRLSAEIDRVLQQALSNDIRKRYQSAPEMKYDLENILRPPPQPINLVPPQPPPKHKNKRRSVPIRLALPLGLLIILGLLAYLLLPLLIHTPPTSPHHGTGIGVTKEPHGEYIGISDGSFAFDTNRPDGKYKLQAADSFRRGDYTDAQSSWQSAVQQETNDPETLIYQEDLRVLTLGSPYVTLVIGTMITGNNSSALSAGHSTLQGAYAAQKEYNDGSKLGTPGTLVRLLIANTGSDPAYVTPVAQQIVQAAQTDHNIVGVMGWPFSSYTLKAISILEKAHIPMVSSASTDDKLKGHYFFRVVPPNMTQAEAGIKYIEQSLHAKSVALFFDPGDAYSGSLATAFEKQFTADGNTIVVKETYTVGKPATIPALLQDALTHSPDLIYFSGLASDASVLLADLPTSGPFAKLLVMGGDGLYIVGAYSQSARAAFSRLRFIGLAYPDEWDVLGLAAQKPAFFGEYPQYFNPGGKAPPGTYGFTRPDNKVMVAFDATVVMLEAYRTILQGGKESFTPEDLRQALTTITGSKAIQGVSGQIALGPDGNPIDKALVVLYLDAGGHIKMLPIVEEGHFLKGV